jgi:hypothetical protein
MPRQPRAGRYGIPVEGPVGLQPANQAQIRERGINPQRPLTFGGAIRAVVGFRG